MFCFLVYQIGKPVFFQIYLNFFRKEYRKIKNIKIHDLWTEGSVQMSFNQKNELIEKLKLIIRLDFILNNISFV